MKSTSTARLAAASIGLLPAILLAVALSAAWRPASAGQREPNQAGPPREAPRDGKFAPRTRISIEGGRWHINGRITYPGAKAEGLLLNVRMVNAVFEDRKRPDFDPQSNTDEFLAALPGYHEHGVRAFTICLQGGMPGYEGAVNSAFEPSGELRGEYLSRVRRVVEACDRQGMAVILGCYYQRQDQVLADEAAVRQGVVNVARWIRESGFTNVLLEIANEYPHDGFDHDLLKTAQGQAELIELARREAPGLLVSTSGIGDGKLDREVAEASDFLLIHFNGVAVQDIPDRIAAVRAFGGPGKPIVCNEDDKLAAEAASAAEASVAHGASWGLMLLEHNQEFPFTFKGAADDPVVYAKLKELSTAQPADEQQGAGKAAKRTRPPLGSSSPVSAHPRLPPSPFPRESWMTRQPAEVDRDTERLDELVASWNDGQVEGRQRQNRALELLVRTVTKDRR